MRCVCSTLVLFIVCASPSVYAKEKKITYSLVYNCSYDSKVAYCLADSVKEGLGVVLIYRDRPGSCSAVTTQKFIYEHPLRGIESTRIKLSGNCSGPFAVGVLNITPSGLQFPEIKSVRNLSKKLDADARKLAEHPNAPAMYRLAVTSPRVVAAVNIKLLFYNYVSDTQSGPAVIAIGNRLFRLEGDCIRDYAFFYINKKLHLYYRWTGCNSGQNVALIYDLSSGVPVEVYGNAMLST